MFADKKNAPAFLGQEFFYNFVLSVIKVILSCHVIGGLRHGNIEIVVNSRKTTVLTSAEETRLTCFILLQNIFFWSNQPSLTADVNTIINLPWYPRKIVHFSLVLSPSRVYYDFYAWQWKENHSKNDFKQSSNLKTIFLTSKNSDRENYFWLNCKLRKIN